MEGDLDREWKKNYEHYDYTSRPPLPKCCPKYTTDRITFYIVRDTEEKLTWNIPLTKYKKNDWLNYINKKRNNNERTVIILNTLFLTCGSYEIGLNILGAFAEMEEPL